MGDGALEDSHVDGLADRVGTPVTARTAGDPIAAQELQRLSLLREIAYLEVARDPEAYDRLTRILGQQA